MQRLHNNYGNHRVNPMPPLHQPDVTSFTHGSRKITIMTIMRCSQRQSECWLNRSFRLLLYCGFYRLVETPKAGFCFLPRGLMPFSQQKTPAESAIYLADPTGAWFRYRLILYQFAGFRFLTFRSFLFHQEQRTIIRDIAECFQ